MSKIITHEMYVDKLKSKELRIEPVEKYINAKTPILHHCLKHDIFWKISPGNALKGKGCSICKSEKIRNKFLKTSEQYKNNLAQKNPYLEVLEDYIDSQTPILHRCTIYDVEWKIIPSNALKGCGCYKCKRDKIINCNLKTHEEYSQELNNINPHISILEKYIDGGTSILHHCTIHNIDYKCTPNNALNNYGCPQCSLEHHREAQLLSNKEYLSLLSIKNPNIEPIENYIDSKTKISHLCKIHNYTWKVTPTSVLNGGGCPKCRSEKISQKQALTKAEYIQKLKEANEYVTLIGNYINMKTPILHKCLKDNYVWKIAPSHMLYNIGCPKCNCSKGEKLIAEWLDKNNIVYIAQYKFDDCRDKRHLPFDFYLSDYNKVIEYDGLQHFKPVEYFGGQQGFEITKRHDNIKNNYCKTHDIPLLRISYKQNIEEELDNFLFN